MYKITNMNTSFSCFVKSHNKCGLTVIISCFYIKNCSWHPHFSHKKTLTENQRLPFVWLKCSVKMFKSHLRVIWTEKWNQVHVTTVSVGYPGIRIPCTALGYVAKLWVYVYKHEGFDGETVKYIMTLNACLYSIRVSCMCNKSIPEYIWVIPPLWHGILVT